MGAGDILMAMGEARAVHRKTGRRVCIIGRDGRVQRSDLMRGVAYLTDVPARGVERVVSGSGHRPYIVSKAPDRWTWRPYQPKPAEMVFSPEELTVGLLNQRTVMVEPNGKEIGHENKLWGFDRWQQVVRELRSRGIEPVQCGPLGARRLDGVHFAQTPTFRHAAAVLQRCDVFAGGEGGMMHAAATVETPGVILWSHFISPEVTGYAMHTNLRHADGLGCGSRTNCPECRASMQRITVDEVVAAILRKLK